MIQQSNQNIQFNSDLALFSVPLSQFFLASHTDISPVIFKLFCLANEYYQRYSTISSAADTIIHQRAKKVTLDLTLDDGRSETYFLRKKRVAQ